MQFSGWQQFAYIPGPKRWTWGTQLTAHSIVKG